MSQERFGARGAPSRTLVREPLLWTAVAAFVGSAVGLAGTSRLAAWFGKAYGPVGPPPALLWLVPPAGELLVVVSLLGVLPLLSATRKARVAGLLGVPPLLLLLGLFLWNMAFELGWVSFGGEPPGGPPAFYVAVVVLGLCLPPLAILPFALAAFLGREARVGAMLLVLCVLAVPHLLARQLLFGGVLGEIPQDVAAPVLLGGIGMGVSLLEAPLWALFGAVLFRAARERARGEEFRTREKANARAARRLYEEGLGARDAPVLDELVSEGFRDLKSGARGRPAMERVFSALWRSYPDLAVSIQDQEAEGDFVRTRLTLSGTDEGGVMWYPPTGRRASFSAVFADRFEDGLVVEHEGEADTEGLLRQLGHPKGRGEDGQPSAR